jgi:lipoprotein-releasing system permease protein
MPPIAAPAAGHATLRPVIIGQELARSLAASVGSRITVISPDGDVGPMGVQPRARPFTVAAIFATGMYEYDLKFAYMYLPDAQDFFNLGDTVDHLDVRLADLAATDAVWPRVSELAGPGAQVLTWKEMNRNLLSALELERVVMFVVLGFIILIASFNIVTSLVILIRRRLSAIAIMKTSGASSGQVTRVFFLLGSAIGLIGILSGIIMGLSACAVLSHLGLTLPKEFYIRRLPVQVDPWQVALIAAVALTVIALASLYPGRLAARVSVVEGLKDER